MDKEKYHKFKTVEAFEKYLKEDNNAPDVVIIGDIVYTMDHYDQEGELITYGNKKHWKGLRVETTNRYGVMKYSDAHIEELDDAVLRNDIAYVE